MDIALIKDALGLDITASDTEVLGRIAQLMAGAGEGVGDPPIVRLLKAGQHEQCAMNPDGSIVVTLLVPLKFGNGLIQELTFQRPKLRDLRASSKLEGFDWVAAMISALSKQTDKVLDDMDQADVAVCTAVVGFLSQERPRTGPK